ncbi:hypothetical protein KO528_17015 [Saccharophagus degradans]|uniref:hypothetical protein n=1 Tax=Saccharophagus degradans TaxID=86304 RepID=UPI001C08B8DE|nr:hypothetical protein [Saccharophagus degradans]MBU2987070.1 hypothetical protein [Saccharophagus degradans]
MFDLTALRCSLLIIFTLLTACSKAPSPISPPLDFSHYKNKGLEFHYPSNWSLLYDDEPLLYSSRGVSFNISEFSTASVFIVYQDQINQYAASSLADFTNQYLRTLGLDNKANITNISQTAKPIAGNNSITISWVDTVASAAPFELTVVERTTESNKIYVVFNLSAEDILTSTKHLAPLVYNLSYEK